MARNSREPVGNTCPLIDDVINGIERAMVSLKDENIDSDQYKEFVEDAISELNGLRSTLEDIRSANLSLRTWGNEESEKVNNLEETIGDLENQISKLETQISDLEKSVSNLESDNEILKIELSNLE